MCERNFVISAWRKGTSSVLLCLLIALTLWAEAQSGHLAVTNRKGEPVVFYEGSYALVIGVERYTGTGWSVLPGVPGDVEAVSAAFRRHGFIVETVMDPDHSELKPAVESFIHRRGLVPGHRLVIYFAGHGHSLRQSYGERVGYLVPADAPHPGLDRDGFLARAMSMTEVAVLARKIQAKHALFLFDSCFAGSIFTLQRGSEAPVSISDRVAEPVRFFITAGKADEMVPDQSVFRRELVAALDGDADLYKDGFVTGMELGEFLYNQVTNYTIGRQHPQYGKLRHPHLDKGDFVFRVPAHEIEAEQTPAPPADERSPLEGSKARAEVLEVNQEQATAHADRPAPRPRPGDRRTETIGGTEFALRYVPGGEFLMGSPKSEAARDSDETLHPVTLTRPFWMLETEVTQEQWRRIMGTNPAYFLNCGSDCPIERVSWYDALTFANELSELAGQEPCYELHGCAGEASSPGAEVSSSNAGALSPARW